MTKLKKVGDAIDEQLSAKKKPVKRSRKPNPRKPVTPPRLCSDNAHGECRMVAVTGGVFEVIECPWCGFKLTPSNAGKWCADCYTLYEIVESERGKVAHFGKGIEPTLSVALAIAIAKSGGLRIGM